MGVKDWFGAFTEISPLGNFCNWQAVIKDAFFLNVPMVVVADKMASAVNILPYNLYHVLSVLTQQRMEFKILLLC